MSNPTTRSGSTHEHVKRMTGMAIFTAIIVVLQIVATFVKFGPVSITLALAPIVIGAAMYGKLAGLYLGTVFGVVVFLAGVFGWDGGFVMLLMGYNAPATVALCILKGTFAGFLSGLVYELLAKKSVLGGTIAAGIVCPVVNTGLFALGMLTIFNPVLSDLAGGGAVLIYLLTGMIGVNFIIELLVNLILSSGISRIIRVGKRM